MTPAGTSNSNVEFINPEQGKRILALCYKAKVPTFFVGGPATAKTTIHADFVDWLNENLPKGAKQFGFWPYSMAASDPTSFAYPVADKEKGHVRELPPESLPFNQPDARGMIFLDEADDLEADNMQATMMNLVHDQKFCGNTLSDGVLTSMAGNGSSDSGTIEMREALISRMCVLYVSAHSAGFEESWQQWAMAEGVDTAVRTFRRLSSDLIQRHEDYEEMSVCNDRTLAMADRILQASRSVKFQTDDILLPAIAGCIGKAAAVKLFATIELQEKAPSIEEIVADPEGTPVPAETSIQCGLAMQIVDGCRVREHQGALMTYLLRLNAEITVFGLTFAKQDSAEVFGLPHVLAWMNAPEQKGIML